jgi:predicted dehydrogenase
MARLRIGILGAARIAPMAVIQPARDLPEVEIVAVAARDPARAAAFARKHGLATIHDSYASLVADPGVDAVYNPLPNGLHGRWTIAALEAGKHVLCEKPFTANAEEAEAVAAVARRTGLTTMEAFHYRYHGLTARMLELIASGELGEIRRIEAWFCIPLIIRDIRWDLALAGGALMDTGCYAVHLVRTLAGAEPAVVSARARQRSPGVDRLMQAELAFADGRTGRVTASMLSSRLFGVGARVSGSEATMQVFNPVAPQYRHSLTVRAGRRVRKEQVARAPSSYAAQLHAFAAAVLHGRPYPTTVDDAVANMWTIDACYAAAGLPRREPTTFG